jgi:hypothetical protein
MRCTASYDQSRHEIELRITFSDRERRNAPEPVRELLEYADTPEAPVWEKLYALAELAKVTEFQDAST